MITFSAEDGLHRFRTSSGEEGHYQRRLWPGRYFTRTWTMSFEFPGRYVLFANARDNLYPTPGEAHQASEGLGMGCAEFRVVE